MIDIYVTPESIDNVGRFEVALHELETKLHDYRKPLKEIKEYMKQQWIKNYGSEGQGQWAALSSTWTIPERTRKGFGGGPKLRRTGSMFGHFEIQNEMGKVDFNSVDWEMTNATDAYTVRHDEGYSNPLPRHAPIPSRPLWPITGDDERRMELEISLYADEVLEETFGGL